MKDYTNSNPTFSKSLKIIEVSDVVHADIVNTALIQLMQNTLSNRNAINAIMKYSYDSDSRQISQMLPLDYDNGKLTIPEGMGSVSGDTLVLSIA